MAASSPTASARPPSPACAFALRLAAENRLSGVGTWHGSRMEQHLGRAGDITCPLRLHFGEDDPVTPPAAIDAIRKAFASHPDARIVVHAGASHGFSHDGPAYDARACRAGLDAVGELVRRHQGPTRASAIR